MIEAEDQRVKLKYSFLDEWMLKEIVGRRAAILEKIHSSGRGRRVRGWIRKQGGKVFLLSAEDLDPDFDKYHGKAMETSSRHGYLLSWFNAVINEQK